MFWKNMRRRAAGKREKRSRPWTGVHVPPTDTDEEDEEVVGPSRPTLKASDEFTARDLRDDPDAVQEEASKEILKFHNR